MFLDFVWFDFVSSLLAERKAGQNVREMTGFCRVKRKKPELEPSTCHGAGDRITAY